MVILHLGIQTKRHWDEILGVYWSVNIVGPNDQYIEIKTFDTIELADEFVRTLGTISDNLKKEYKL